ASARSGTITRNSDERVEAPGGFEPPYEGFAVPCLTNLATVPQGPMLVTRKRRLRQAPAAAAAAGSVNTNEQPRPWALSTQMRPPCASTIPFAIARPRPSPLVC